MCVCIYIYKIVWAQGVSAVVEHLSSMNEALDLIPKNKQQNSRRNTILKISFFHFSVSFLSLCLLFIHS